MATESVRIVVEVVAGIIPNTPMLEYTRRFIVTQKQWEENPDAVMKAYGHSQEYMRTLWNPKSINWVRCDWIYL